MSNVDVPNSNAIIIWTHVFEWFVIGFWSKSGHQKNMFSREVGLHAQNMLTILSLVINMIGKGGAI